MWGWDRNGRCFGWAAVKGVGGDVVVGPPAPHPAPQVDIFGKELLLIPIHLEVHWSLVAVDVLRRRITYFDSQRTLNRRCPKVGGASARGRAFRVGGRGLWGVGSAIGGCGFGGGGAYGGGVAFGRGWGLLGLFSMRGRGGFGVATWLMGGGGASGEGVWPLGGGGACGGSGL